MRSGRPDMPAGYGIKAGDAGTLDWSWVVEQCTISRNYWICTTRPDGRPHAMPVWGLWLDDAVVFSTDPESLKARNFSARPEVVVHLESGDEMVVIEGRVQALDRSLVEAFVDAYDAKYAYRPSAEQT